MAPSEIVNQGLDDTHIHTLKKQAHSTLIKPPLPNISLQATADHTLKQVEAPVSAPCEGEVLLQIKATGICGYVDRRGSNGKVIRLLIQARYNRSDIHFWKTGRIGSLVFEGDCILGHEAAGVVLRCGSGVTGIKPGTLWQYSY